jgi:SulP family sulfate permease
LTAARLIDVQRLRYVVRASRQDATVLAITVISALAFGLDWAILVGVGLSILIFVPRAARLKSVELVIDTDGIVRERLDDDAAPAGFALFDLEGELFFGAAIELDRCLRDISRRAVGRHEIVILRLKRVRNPDVVCLEALEHFLRDCGRHGTVVLLAGVRRDLLDAFRRLRLTDWFPGERIFRQGDDEDSATLAAIRAARDWLAHYSSHAAPTTQELHYRI